LCHSENIGNLDKVVELYVLRASRKPVPTTETVKSIETDGKKEKMDLGPLVNAVLGHPNSKVEQNY
jgi:hypothetical protein